MKVKCNWCEWQGDEKDIAYDEVDDTIEVCPKCHKSECLMDIEEEEAIENIKRDHPADEWQNNEW